MKSSCRNRDGDFANTNTVMNYDIILLLPARCDSTMSPIGCDYITYSRSRIKNLSFCVKKLWASSEKKNCYLLFLKLGQREDETDLNLRTQF